MNLALRSSIAAIMMCGSAVTAAHAQSSAAAPSPASKAKTANPSDSLAVETWTKKQWEAAKKEWVKDKTRWVDCNNDAKKRKLEGKKSWSFLYSCMTK